MFSKFDSEFGEVVLKTSGVVLPDSIEKESIYQSLLIGDISMVPFLTRVSEMEYFLRCFTMFNPQIIESYEKKTQQPETPEDFPF